MATNPFISKESLGEVAEWVMFNPPPTAFFEIYSLTKNFQLRGVFGYYTGNTTVGNFLSYPGGFWPKTVITRYLTDGPTTSNWEGLYLFTPVDFSIQFNKDKVCFRALPEEVTENSKTVTNISHTLHFCAYNVGINRSKNVFIDMDVIHSRATPVIASWSSKIQNVSLHSTGDSSYTYSGFITHVI